MNDYKQISIREVPSYYWKEGQTITTENGEVLPWYEAVQKYPNLGIWVNEEGRPATKKELTDYARSFYTQDQLDKADAEEIRQKKADENPIANLPKVKRVSDYEALFGDTRVKNANRAWRNSPQTMQSFKDANDFVGLTTIGAFALGSGLAGNALKWTNTLMTPSTYTDLIGLPYWLGSAANAGVSSYWLYDSGKKFIEDPSLENGIFTAMSLIPATRAGTDDTVNALAKYIGKGLGKVNSNLGNTYNNIQSVRALDRELLKGMQSYDKLKKYSKFKEKASRLLNELAIRDMEKQLTYSELDRSILDVGNEMSKLSERLNHEDKVKSYYEHLLKNLDRILETTNNDIHYNLSNLNNYIVPRIIRVSNYGRSRYNNLRYNALGKYYSWTINSGSLFSAYTDPNELNNLVPKYLRYNRRDRIISPLSPTHPDTQGNPFISDYSNITEVGDFQIPIFGTDDAVTGVITSPGKKIIDHKGTMIDLGDDFVVPKEYVDVQAHNIKYVEENVPGAVVFGSTRGTQAGLPHISADYDVYITDKLIPKLEEKFGPINEWKVKVGNLGAVETYAVKLDNGKYGKYGKYDQNGELVEDPSDIDLNIIYTDVDGTTKPTQRSLELYKLFFPDEFQVAIEEAMRTNPGSLWSLHIKINKTPEELLDAIKKEPEVKTVMDSFNSAKPKHEGRALIYLRDGDPDVVRTALVRNMQSLLGSSGRTAPVSIELFLDVLKNKELLKRLQCPESMIDKISSDPKKMYNYFEYWWQNNTILSRGIDTPSFDSADDFIENTQTYMRLWSGSKADYSGSGLNTVYFGNSSHGNHVYGHILPKLEIPENATPDLIVDIVQTLFGRFDFEFTDTDKKIIRKILEKYGVETESGNVDRFSDLSKLVHLPEDIWLNRSKAVAEISEVLKLQGHTLSSRNADRFGPGSYGNSIFFGGFRPFTDTEDIVGLGPNWLDALHPGSYVSRNLHIGNVDDDIHPITLTRFSPHERMLYLDNISDRDKLPRYKTFTREQALDKIKTLESRKNELELELGRFKDVNIDLKILDLEFELMLSEPSERQQIRSKLDELRELRPEITRIKLNINRIDLWIEHLEFSVNKYDLIRNNTKKYRTNLKRLRKKKKRLEENIDKLSSEKDRAITFAREKDLKIIKDLEELDFKRDNLKNQQELIYSERRILSDRKWDIEGHLELYGINKKKIYRDLAFKGLGVGSGLLGQFINNLPTYEELEELIMKDIYKTKETKRNYNSKNNPLLNYVEP